MSSLHCLSLSLKRRGGRNVLFFWEEKVGGVYHGVLVLVLSIGIRGFSFLLYFTLLYIDTQEHQSSSSSIIILQYLSIYRSRFETRKNQGLHKRITCSKLMITKSKFVHLFVIMF